MKNLTPSQGQPQTSPILYPTKYTSNGVRVRVSPRVQVMIWATVRSSVRVMIWATVRVTYD